MGGYVTERNFEMVIKNMQNISPARSAKLLASMNVAGDVLENKVLEKAALTDHSLKDLAKMGHPYGYKSGDSMKIGDKSKMTGSTDSGPHPDEFVHRQSSNLYNNIERVVELEGDRAIVAVGVDEKKVYYLPYLIHGTSKMRPRDFLGHAWVEVRETVIKIIKYGLTPNRGTRGGTTRNTKG
jgi:hypothetical protein